MVRARAKIRTIKIKKANQGKFTAWAKKKGLAKKGGGISKKAIAAALKSKNPAVRKRAVFAKNARLWKHSKKKK